MNMGTPIALACLLGLVFISVVQGDAHTSPCMSNFQSTACLQAVQALMVDQNRFWFGTNYSINCPPGGFGIGCTNGDSQHLSIMSRLMKTDSVNANGITQVLNVTFQVPSGSYEACGNTYEVDAVTHTVDPLHTSDISLWSADHQPHVTWSSPQANQMYSLIVWDAGALILHGMFYNIQGSNLQNARVAKPYHGPKNPSNRDQPYAFLLYTQSRELDPKRVMTSLESALASSQGSQMTFTPVVITSQFSSVLSGPVGASVLTVNTDPYAAGYMKKNKIVNNCPAMLTPVFQQLPLVYDVGSVSLTVDVDVTYKTEEMTINSCCREVRIPAATRMANPMGNGDIRPVYTRHEPHVTLVPSNFFDTYFLLRRMYTLLMLDVTEDLDANNNNPNILLHWQVVNIMEGELMAGETTKSYQKPLPLTDGGSHVMMFLLLHQSSLVTTTGLDRFVGSDCPAHLTGRCSFNLTGFINEHGMTIDGASWFITSADEYSRYEVIRMALQGTSAACVGIEEYGDPCPNPTCGAELAHASTLGIALVLVVSSLKLFVQF